MMKVIETPISPFLQNAPIAFCEKSMESIFFDPGDEIEKLLNTSQLTNDPTTVLIALSFCAVAGYLLKFFYEKSFFSTFINFFTIRICPCFDFCNWESF